MKKILILLGVLVIIGVGWFIISSNESADNDYLFSYTKTNTTEVPKKPDNANWTTHIHSLHNFEISYPSSFVFSDDGTDELPYFSIRREELPKNTFSGPPVIIGSITRSVIPYNGNIVDYVDSNKNHFYPYDDVHTIERIDLGRLEGAKVTATVEDGLGTITDIITIYVIDPEQPNLLFRTSLWFYNASESDRVDFLKIIETLKVNGLSAVSPLTQ